LSVHTLPPVAATSRLIEQAERRERARLAAKYRRRRLIRLIDRAIARCEAANLADVVEAPTQSADLVEQLRVLWSETGQRPTTTAETLDELYRLQGRYFLVAEDDDEDAE
jgi:hypothetical protein